MEFHDSGIIDEVTSKEHNIDGKVVDVKKPYISDKVKYFCLLVCLFVCLFVCLGVL